MKDFSHRHGYGKQERDSAKREVAPEELRAFIPRFLLNERKLDREYIREMVPRGSRRSQTTGTTGVRATFGKKRLTL